MRVQCCQLLKELNNRNGTGVENVVWRRLQTLGSIRLALVVVEFELSGRKAFIHGVQGRIISAERHKISESKMNEGDQKEAFGVFISTFEYRSI